MRTPQFTSLLRILSLASLVCALPAQWAGEWKLDETSGVVATDLSPSGNTGNLRNFVGNPWVPGKFGNGLEFAAGVTDDFVEVATNANLPVYDGKGSPFSIAFWVKAPAPAAESYVYSESSSTITSPGPIFGLLGRPNGSLRVFIRTDTPRNAVLLDSVSTVFDDTWHHVAYVEVSGDISVYIDGVKDAQNFVYDANEGPGESNYGPYNFTAVSFGALVRAARSPFPNVSSAFAGSIDDMRVYRFALSAADVGLVIAGTPLLPCRASIGKFGVGCGGTLDISATGSAGFGQQLNLQLNGGTPSAPALLLVGAPLDPLELSFMGFPGCVAYPSLATSFSSPIGLINAMGSSLTLSPTVPNQPASACAIALIQGIVLNGSQIELSPAALVQIGN